MSITREATILEHFELLAGALAKAGVPFAQNEPMSRHTTFGVGGPAALFISPATAPQAAAAQRLCREQAVRLMPLGRGSNMLVDDGGLPFAVLHLGDAFSGIRQVTDTTLEVLAGTKLAVLCTRAAELSLAGLEFGYGIPGALGGCVYMNAGAYGGEMCSVVRSVTFLDEAGAERTFSGGALDFSYRHSVFSDRGCIILSALVELTPGNGVDIRRLMEDYMNRRREKQPLEYGSAGSTFKRPAGAFAAALIDQCGLKGYTVGGAQVSEKHAGFVINRGGATSADVRAVMAHVADTVLERTGYRLDPEMLLLP